MPAIPCAPCRRTHMAAVCGLCMADEKKGGADDRPWATTAVMGELTGNETEAEQRAAIARWTSLPAEERRRLMVEYGEKRMRLERLGEIP